MMPRAPKKKLRGVYENPSGSGIWWIQYFDASGRRRREKAGRRSDAIDLLAKRKTEKLQRFKLPENFRAKAVTFGELMDDALEHSKAANVERSTTELRMKYDILRPVFGGRTAEEITKQEIIRWLTEAKEERKWGSDATRNRWQAAFSLAFAVGMDNEKIERNPASRIRRKAEDNGRIRFLDQKEVRAIRKALAEKYPQHIPAFDISTHTGARAGEQFGLRWDSVDLKQKFVQLPNKRTESGKWRFVPLNAVALETFKKLRENNPVSPWVFVNRKGEKLRSHRDWFEPAVKVSGVQNYTWHCNRHTFASRLVMAGVNLRTVAQLMGHRTIQMTMRFAHLAPDHQQSAVERLVRISNVRKSLRGQCATKTAIVLGDNS
jgi:site-specific recombinase XerD